MPTNEHIIEAARRRMAQGDVLRIETELTSGYSTDKYTVVFSDRGHWTVTPEEAEAVALEPKQEDVGHCDYPCDADKGYNLICNACTKGVSLLVKEPKQEHDHNSHDCNGCANIERQAWNRAIKFNEAGKALLSNHDHDTEACVLCEEMYYKRKPLDRDALAEFLRTFALTSNVYERVAEAIADNFAAPERKPFHITTEMRTYFREAYNASARRNGWPELAPSGVWTAFHEMEKVYGDEKQPAPVEAERCPYCDHKDGSTNLEHLKDQGLLVCAWGLCECAHEFHRERGTV